MTLTENLYEEQLRELVRGSVWFMQILRAVRYCDPPNWLVGGGVIRNLVWNRAHGYADATYVKDVDVVFFDAEDLNPERERAFEQGLLARCPDVPWDAKNQAAVHLWYEEKFGYAVPPLSSSEEGVGANPETATSVGVRLLADDELYIVAPLGLDNLFELVLRRNPRRVTPEIFRKRLVDKGIREKWPKVRIVDEAHMKVS
jgi:hypothetical protein